MHTRMKIRIRDKVIKYPKIYKFLRATYHGLKTFYSINSEPARKNQTLGKSVRPTKGILLASFFSKAEPILTMIDRDSRQSKVTLDIIIPVFNRGDLAADLISALQIQIEGASELLKINLICADDCSEFPTSKRLSELCNQFGFNYVRRKINLGFIRNVNFAWESSESEFVLLLNSDVKISDGFLDRVLDPMIHDHTVGLSTNPTFGTFAPRMQPGLNLNSLNAYLLSTSANQVSFLDACTAVGYSLVVRRSAIKESFLLDSEYGRGYGEDSDLHYRVIANGFRSVWNLDSSVSHYGGASFGITDSVDEDKKSGRARFLRKWGNRYLSEIDSHNLALNLAIDRRVAGYSIDNEMSTWIVLPTVKGNVGGILVGCELAIAKSQNDYRTKVVTLDGSEGSVIGDYLSVGKISQLFEKKASGTVILVGAQSLELLSDENWVNPKLTYIYFSQGPDWLIDPSTLDLYRELIPRINEVLSVSNYMDAEMPKFSNTIVITRYSPELGYARYSGLANRIKTIDFFLVYREETGKLGWLTLALANFLSKTHSVIVVSKSRPFGLSKNVDFVTDLNRDSMLKYFAQSSVYIDTSIFEGFGLTPREAALQNSRVLFMDVADGRTELKNYPSHFLTFNFSPSVFELAELAKKALAKPSCSGCNFCVN